MERNNKQPNLYGDWYNMNQERAAFEALLYREAKLRKNSEVQESAGRAVMYYLLRQTGLDTLADVPLVSRNGYLKDEKGENVTVVNYIASGLASNHGPAEQTLLDGIETEPGKEMDNLRAFLSEMILGYTPQDHPQVEAFLASPASTNWSKPAAAHQTDFAKAA